jgi:hypothetical protein
VSTRKIPAYVEKPAWAVYDAYVQWLDDDDLDALRDAVTDLRDALVRGDALMYAPKYALAEIFQVSA